MDLLEQIRQAASNPEPESNEKTAFQEAREQFLISDEKQYPEPEYLIKYKDVPVMPKGNLAALSAKWKSGKTFFCDILAAVFLGSEAFNGFKSMMQRGKVLFFDTEQAISDTARIKRIIRRLIPEERKNDIQVFCLRNADIDEENGQRVMSRYRFIKEAILHEKPDMVIIDGIADLIYNYNDVVESQSMVNELARLANESNTCICVVMHQNKGKQDKSMKGHIGTMLYQKCSDVFNIEKHDKLFIVTHPVSRHRNIEEVFFKLDERGTPYDATAERQLQAEVEQQNDRAKMASDFEPFFEDNEDGIIKRSLLVKAVQREYKLSASRAYAMIKKAIEMQVLETKPNGYVKFDS